MTPIVIIARNNLHLTKAAVRTALAQTCPSFVIVLDNASNDGTVQWLRSKLVGMIAFPKQAALAKCWNYALSMLWKQGHTKCLVLNNDVELREDFLSKLSLVELPFVTGVSVNSKEQLNQPLGPQELRPHPDFSAFLIRKSVTNRVGFFNEAYYPAYYEDNDYHVRMHRAGIEAMCLNVPFYHAGAQTMGAALDGELAKIQRGAAQGKELFRKTYGCYPATAAYESLFK